MIDISPREVQKAVHSGIRRLQNFRSARLMFLRNYTGPYYDRDHGEIGHEALNLIFNAIRAIVPTIVMSFPKFNVSSRFLAYKEYAELLALALNYHSKQNKIHEVYRRVVVDAIFTLGILKTGIAESDSVYAFDESTEIDAGEVYTEAVDFDNFIVDPSSREYLFRDARFIGDRITVSREALLASGLYRNDLIEQLPGLSEEAKKKRAEHLSKSEINAADEYDLEDEVEIAELWVPQAKALITIPASENVLFDDYLRVDDYYGPDSGPYTFLSLTPPVPGNALPVPAVGIWNDLHILANRMAKKIIDQAERQKDIVAYRRSAADDAQELQDAMDGEAIAVDDPDGVKVLSFGGQRQSNEVHVAHLTNWFNMMAANPQSIAGERMDARSATEANILQHNANIGIDDMKDLVYQMAASEGSKRAWYFHTDPMIELPLIRRRQVPAQVSMGIMLSPPQMVEEQVFLTPEVRRGDWMDFTFEVEPESMGRMNSQRRLQQAIDFAVKVMPAAAATAQTMMMLGIPFNIKEYILNMAKDAGIEWMDQVFFDPEFQQRMMMRMLAGPTPGGSQGQFGGGGGFGIPNAGIGGGPNAGIGTNPLGAILQNGQPGGVAEEALSPFGQSRRALQHQAQTGAVYGGI